MQFRLQGNRIQLMVSRQVFVDPAHRDLGKRKDVRMIGSVSADPYAVDLPPELAERLTRAESTEAKQYLRTRYLNARSAARVREAQSLPALLHAAAFGIEIGDFVPDPGWAAALVEGIERLIQSLNDKDPNLLPLFQEVEPCATPTK